MFRTTLLLSSSLAVNERDARLKAIGGSSNEIRYLSTSFDGIIKFQVAIFRKVIYFFKEKYDEN